MVLTLERTFFASIMFVAMVAQPGLGEVFLWPQPRSVVWGSGPAIPLARSFTIRVPDGSPPELRQAAKRFCLLVLTERWVPVQVPAVVSETDPLAAPASVEDLAFLTVRVADLLADLQQGVNESYMLVVPDGGEGATLEAATVWGALHGLETFSQLVTWRAGGGDGGGAGGRIVVERGVMINDAPLYGYRGVLLDVARNFYPVGDLLRTVRAMAYNKLNVLHLHLTDSQSFPIELPSEPELASKGALGPQFVYSAADIRRLVAYSRSYGVRLVPEIDTPGHSGSWGGAYPQFVTCRDGFSWQSVALEPAPGQLNPLLSDTYRVVKNVINDVASAFPDHLFHGGSDEVVSACWMASSDIATYVHDGGTLSDLLQRFVYITHPYITSHNKTAIYWEDVLLNDNVHVSPSVLPPETTILETWNNGPLNTKRLTSAGYRTIVASSDFYYLDCGRGDFVGNNTNVDVQVNPSPGTPTYNYGGSGGSWCAPYKSWQRIYDYDIAYNLTAEEAELVVGGEVSLWSEQADAAVLDGLLWPRASALAESLWSGNRDAQGQRRSVDALYRLNDWRYRLLSRGIKAMPLQPMWCLKNPGQCNYI